MVFLSGERYTWRRYQWRWEKIQFLLKWDCGFSLNSVCQEFSDVRQFSKFFVRSWHHVNVDVCIVKPKWNSCMNTVRARKIVCKPFVNLMHPPVNMFITLVLSPGQVNWLPPKSESWWGRKVMWIVMFKSITETGTSSNSIAFLQE